jgi:hypothetical protein
VIREDRELHALLARLNRELAPLAMRIMEHAASAAEQADYAQRLIAAGERLRRRAAGENAVVIEGEVVHTIDRSPCRGLPQSRTGSREQRLGDTVPAALRTA